MITITKRLFQKVYNLPKLPTNSQIKAKFKSLKISKIESWCEVFECLMSFWEELNIPEEDLNDLESVAKKLGVIVNDGQSDYLIYKRMYNKKYNMVINENIGKINKSIFQIFKKVSASISNNHRRFRDFENVEIAIKTMIAVKEKEFATKTLAQVSGLY